jgi:hypothetical protein
VAKTVSLELTQPSWSLGCHLLSWVLAFISAPVKYSISAHLSPSQYVCCDLFFQNISDIVITSTICFLPNPAFPLPSSLTVLLVLLSQSRI